MSRRTSVTVFMLSVLVLAACDTTVLEPRLDAQPAAFTVVDPEPHEYTFTAKAGDPVFIIAPGNPGGGGFTGQLYDGRSGRHVGHFVTDILPASATDIFTTLGTLMATGTAVVPEVRGTFVISNGTIVDRHTAELQVVGLATTPGYEVLVQATGLGVLTDGSGKYNRDGGSSILVLTMEVDADGQLPALAVSGSFVFRLD